MRLEPIIKAKICNFKDSFGYQSLDDDTAFEYFSNWVILQRHQPNAFTSDFDLMESICVGGNSDMGIDGICIKINGLLIKSLAEAKDLVASNSKIDITFIFVQSKNRNGLKQNEYNQFLTGVKDFIGEKQYQCYNDKIKVWLDIKNYLLSDACCAKWANNPYIYMYYIISGEGESTPYIEAANNRIVDEIKKINIYHKEVNIEIINSEKLKKYCDETENNYDATLNILESCSFLGENEDISGVASNSTVAICRASELLKLIVSDDGLLRRGIFDDNVRDYQGETAINGEILQTIDKKPENFVLYNNGITIVCKELITRGKSLIIKSPQIVNGCQTCNVLFEANKVKENEARLSKVKVVLKIISTLDDQIINEVVRGTNRQNIVQDEAFETIREFHKNLEAFFQSANGLYGLQTLYYERRAKQYENFNIKELSKVKFSTLIRAFVGVFLQLPHRSINHPATLQKDFKNKIFLDGQSLLPYYTCAQINYFIEKSSRDEKNYAPLKSFKIHIAYLFCLIIGGFIPNLNNAKQIDSYCEKIINVLQDKTKASAYLEKAIELFSEARNEWITIKGREYRNAMKDRPEFTDFIFEMYRKKYIVSSQ